MGKKCDVAHDIILSCFFALYQLFYSFCLCVTFLEVEGSARNFEEAPNEFGYYNREIQPHKLKYAHRTPC